MKVHNSWLQKNMLYLGCHLWMKLLKLSIQSIILLYQLLVREHRKKSELRSGASQLLLGLALSHDNVSKNSLAFTSDTFKRRCFSSPLRTSYLSGSTTTCSVSTEKIFPAPLNAIWFPWSPQELSTLPLTTWPQKKSLQKSSYKHQTYMDALPGCSPDHNITSQLGKLPGSVHSPDLPRGLLRSEMAPDGHSTTHKVSICKLPDHKLADSFLILYSVGSFPKAVLQGQYYVSTGKKWEEKTKPLRYLSNTYLHLHLHGVLRRSSLLLSLH